MKRVLVIGDTMLDHYVYGSVDRLNPEASYSVILNKNSEKVSLGGAANVAANLASTNEGEVIVDYMGVVSEEVQDMFSEFGVNSDILSQQKVLLKQRFVNKGSNVYLLRVDEGDQYFFQDEELIDFFKQKNEKYCWDLIVVSDYNKGTVTSLFMDAVMFAAPVIMDMKSSKNLPCHLRSSLILKCNEKEWNQAIEDGVSRLDFMSVFVTCGAGGCVAYNKEEEWMFPVKKQPFVDVVGAGDAFLVGMANSWLQGKTKIAELAGAGNAYANAKIKNSGTYVLKKKDVT